MLSKLWIVHGLVTFSHVAVAQALVNEEMCSTLYEEITQTQTKDSRDKLIRRYADNCINTSSVCLSVDCAVNTDEEAEVVTESPAITEIANPEQSYDPSIVSAPDTSFDKCADLIKQMNDLKGQPQRKFTLQQEYDQTCTNN